MDFNFFHYLIKDKLAVLKDDLDEEIIAREIRDSVFLMVYQGKFNPDEMDIEVKKRPKEFFGIEDDWVVLIKPKQEAALDELVKQAQEKGMGY